MILIAIESFKCRQCGHEEIAEQRCGVPWGSEQPIITVALPADWHTLDDKLLCSQTCLRRHVNAEAVTP
jgi:hypothetical protein